MSGQPLTSRQFEEQPQAVERKLGRPVQAIWDRLEAGGWRPFGRLEKFRALCPAHDDQRNPGLVVSERQDGSAGVHCFGGCDAQAVVSALGLTLADLFAGAPAGLPRRKRKPPLKPGRLPDDTWPINRVLARFWPNYRATAQPELWTATCRICDGEVWIHAECDEAGRPCGPVRVSCENGCYR